MIHRLYISAPAKKKTENGGNKNLKRQKKKIKSSEDSDTDDMFTAKQSVSALVLFDICASHSYAVSSCHQFSLNFDFLAEEKKEEVRFRG